MSEFSWIGIDPGKSGAIACLDEKYELRAWKMPKTELDIYATIELARGNQSFAVIEKVSSSPQMGVTSAFTFGRGYGGLLMALTAAHIPFMEIRPMKWQKRLGCLTKGDKNVTKRMAQQLWPEMKVTHALADAMLIAKYCFDTQRGDVRDE